MSRQVALPQFNMDSVSDGVVLRLALPGVVVTWFVIGPRGVCPRLPDAFADLSTG
jgi:hypothetical protein